MKAAARWLWLALLASCTGRISDNELRPSKVSAELLESELMVGEHTGFADERGSAVLTDAEGTPLRLRLDGSRAPLESHPGNGKALGKVLGLFGAGPFSALVASDGGLFMAESGWLIEPSWSDAMSPEGVRSAALGTGGSAWIAHEAGLYRVQGGELSQLSLEGGAISGVSALAVAKAPDGADAVWFMHGDKLKYAKQTSRTRFEVFEDRSLDEDVLAMAGLSNTPTAPSELWILTSSSLHRRARDSFIEYGLPGEPQALLSSGRFLWLCADQQLFRYDADAEQWSRLTNLPADLKLLAVDPAGSAWVRTAQGKPARVRIAPEPRIEGLFEGARVIEQELAVRARFPSEEAPERVLFSVDDGMPIARQREEAMEAEGTTLGSVDFALGGFDAAFREQTFSLAGLAPAYHTLTIRAQFGSLESVRKVHFEYRPTSAGALSFAKDVQPIFEARCAKCHRDGPAHELSTYEQWVAEKQKIVSAVVEARMPADGPLDPAQIEILQRWAAGESAP